MKQDSEQLPEVRLAKAHEYYAHAVRTHNEIARREAEEALAAAREAIAEEAGLPEEMRYELEGDIQMLRERLTERDPDLVDAHTPASHLPLRAELDVSTMAAALHETEGSAAMALMTAQGRRVVVEATRIRLEALGERLAEELSHVERSLAEMRVHRDAAMQRRRESKPKVETAGGSPDHRGRALPFGERVLLVLALFAALGQAGLAEGIFFDALPMNRVTSALLAFSYALSLGAVAVLVGRSWAASRARRMALSISQLMASLLLVLPPAFLAALQNSHYRNLISNSAIADGSGIATTMVALIGLLFVALAFGLGYQLHVRPLTATMNWDAALNRFEQIDAELAALNAQRRSLLRTYVSRGLTLHAEGLRLDALFVYEAVQQVPDFEDQTLSGLVGELPRWLRDALVELRQEGQFADVGMSAASASAPF